MLNFRNFLKLAFKRIENAFIDLDPVRIHFYSNEIKLRLTIMTLKMYS